MKKGWKIFWVVLIIYIIYAIGVWVFDTLLPALYDFGSTVLQWGAIIGGIYFALACFGGSSSSSRSTPKRNYRSSGNSRSYRETEKWFVGDKGPFSSRYAAEQEAKKQQWFDEQEAKRR